MTEFGIRYEADASGPWSDFVIDSVRLLNKQLEPVELRFYFGEVDVAQKIIGGYKVWDMYGWAVSEDEVSEFEPMWFAGEDGNADADGNTPMDKFCDVTVTWEDRGGKPYARIMHFDGWDDPGTVIGSSG